MNTEGIRNQDWYVPLGADGYDSVFDPEDPNIVYMEIQEGTIHRLDRRSEEVINIQPQPAPNDPPERWNWDAPIQISPHNHKRIYFGSQRVWKSDNQGNSWTSVSKDLTTNTVRYELETMDNRVWSVDDMYDTGAMSKYATLTSISESPKVEGLLYTGSDDGLIHVSEDGGENWRQSALPKVPARSFINDIEASNHDAKTVFAVADAHKFGDYSSYLFMSADRGRTWKSIAGDLPSNTIVWVLKQDHVDKNLLFIGTEYGIYFSPNKGVNWIKLDAGVPTISFRDLELHQRDNDLVGATFGRGFYVLDDYSVLRTISSAIKEKANTLFTVRDAWWYVPSVPMQAKGMPGQGTTRFASENPPFGAVFTYYLSNIPETAKEARKTSEKALREKNANIPFPGWDRLFEESKEDEPQVLLLVSEENGSPIRWIKGSAKKGLHRANWDLKLPPPDPINLTQPAFKPPWAGDAEGPLVAPGNYSVALYVVHNGLLKAQGAPQTFKVKPVATIAPNTDVKAVAEFQAKTSELSRQISSAGRKLGEAGNRLRYMKAAILETPKATPKLFADLNQLEQNLAELQKRLYGDPIKRSLNENATPSIQSRVGEVIYGHWSTRQNPTETHKRNIEIAQTDFNKFKGDLTTYINTLEAYETALEAAGAPYTPGRKLD
jgi:phage pi2 protein 07